MWPLLHAWHSLCYDLKPHTVTYKASSLYLSKGYTDRRCEEERGSLQIPSILQNSRGESRMLELPLGSEGWARWGESEINLGTLHGSPALLVFCGRGQGAWHHTPLCHWKSDTVLHRPLISQHIINLVGNAIAFLPWKTVWLPLQDHMSFQTLDSG